MGNAGQVEIIESPKRVIYAQDGTYGHYVVNTEWTELEDEAEQLRELPHPFPLRPEISPSFFNEDVVIVQEQQSSSMNPSPKKKKL